MRLCQRRSPEISGMPTAPLSRGEAKYMVIRQAIRALSLRAADTLINTIFGWATAMLCGKSPQFRQIRLAKKHQQRKAG
jgi:hypothetical protein